MDERLTRAYAYCDAVTRRYSRSFTFSSAFLPPDKRRAARALYAFCRLSDNIVDEGTADTPAMLERLETWRERMRRPADEQEHPVLLAWADTRERYSIPLRYSEELLDGMRMDLERTRYQTFEELWRYCYLAASTVGINSMYIIGFEDRPETFQRAEELGVALQMTNILRDVGEDWRRGRVYLPQEDLARFGYTEDDLAQGIVDDRWRALMAFEIERTQALYEQALPGLALLNREGQFAIAASAEVYRGILDKIVQNGYDNFRRRAALSTWDKLICLPRLWQAHRRRKPAIPPEEPAEHETGFESSCSAADHETRRAYDF
jgi:phytoene synthase